MPSTKPLFQGCECVRERERVYEWWSNIWSKSQTETDKSRGRRLNATCIHRSRETLTNHNAHVLTQRFLQRFDSISVACVCRYKPHGPPEAPISLCLCDGDGTRCGSGIVGDGESRRDRSSNILRPQLDFLISCFSGWNMKLGGLTWVPSSLGHRSFQKYETDIGKMAG